MEQSMITELPVTTSAAGTDKLVVETADGTKAITKDDLIFKAVSTQANQGLTSTEQSNARSNIGLGTAATKSSTTSISSGGSGLPTAGTVYSYTIPVVVTADDTTPPSNTRALWIYPDV